MTAPLSASTLADRIQTSLNAPVDPAVRAFAAHLGEAAGALAVLFYGSNLRTGSLEGVLDDSVWGGLGDLSDAIHNNFGTLVAQQYLSPLVLNAINPTADNDANFRNVA